MQILIHTHQSLQVDHEPDIPWFPHLGLSKNAVHPNPIGLSSFP